jgi:hypothetical protein
MKQIFTFFSLLMAGLPLMAQTTHTVTLPSTGTNTVNVTCAVGDILLFQSTATPLAIKIFKNNGTSYSVTPSSNTTSYTVTAIDTSYSSILSIAPVSTCVGKINLGSSSNYTVTTASSPTVGGTTAGSGTYASGSSVTVTATANTGYSFVNWTESGSPVSTSATYTFSISANRNLVANFTAISTGIDEASNLNVFLSVYPNPVNDVLQFRINDEGINQANVVLTDMQGKIIKTVKVNNLQSGSFYQISTAQIPQGMYLLKYNNGRNSLVRKCIIIH